MNHNSLKMNDNYPLRDPEEIETKNLRKFIPLEGAHVLEIGSGSGRMTWRFASKARLTASLDLDLDDLLQAKIECPPELISKVDFVCAEAERLPFASLYFDAVVFAWSF